MKRVLLIEDDSNLSYSISLLLSLNNHEVVIADSFKEGLIKIETNTPDIIISEIVLPAYSALDFLSDLKHDEILRDIPCVFLTSVVDESEMQKLLKSGASEIIVKPFKTKKFLESIEKYIGM
jgi:DNA-binding response OmpR family regulator